jgi:hypothetical protein
LTIPGLAAVEASLDRSRLLLQSGTDVAAMALDAPTPFIRPLRSGKNVGTLDGGGTQVLDGTNGHGAGDVHWTE